jgi:DNA-binding NarL/FixJ family response regulator
MSLTPREREVARLVAAGLANKDVAKCLGLSPNTVKNVLMRIYPKVGVSNRTELALRIIREVAA